MFTMISMVGTKSRQFRGSFRSWSDSSFRVGHSARCLSYVRRWVEKKTRRYLMRARQRPGFGWKRWSKGWLYHTLGLFHDYQLRYIPNPRVAPAR
jgi:RNA-directed DNA polymerase